MRIASEGDSYVSYAPSQSDENEGNGPRGTTLRLANVIRKIPVHLQFLKPKRATDAKPSITQFVEMASVFLRYRLTPKDYRFYGLYQRDKPISSASSILSTWWHHKYLLSTLNNPRWADILENKLVFDSWFRGHVRLPDFYGFAHPDFGYDSEGRSLRTQDDLVRLIQTRNLTSFVAKPIGGSQGRQVVVVDDVEYRQGQPVNLKCQNGSILNVTDFSRVVLTSDMIGGLAGFIIQERLVQHPDLTTINPYTLNTLRFVTFRGESGPEVHMAYVKLGRKGQRVDNLGTGGLSVGIEISSGMRSDPLSLDTYSLIGAIFS